MCTINHKIFSQLGTLTALTSVESLGICHWRHLCQLPQSDHANLCGMARDLYQQNPTKYSILKPPNNSNPFKKLDDKTKKDNKKKSKNYPVKRRKTTWKEKEGRINGRKIGEGKGSIALQIHSGGDLKILWRNIKLEKI